MKKFCFEPHQCWRRRGIQGRGSGRLARRAGAQFPLPDLVDLGFSRAVTLSRHHFLIDLATHLDLLRINNSRIQFLILA